MISRPVPSRPVPSRSVPPVCNATRLVVLLVSNARARPLKTEGRSFGRALCPCLSTVAKIRGLPCWDGVVHSFVFASTKWRHEQKQQKNITSNPEHAIYPCGIFELSLPEGSATEPQGVN